MPTTRQIADSLAEVAAQFMSVSEAQELCNNAAALVACGSRPEETYFLLMIKHRERFFELKCSSPEDCARKLFETLSKL